MSRRAVLGLCLLAACGSPVQPEAEREEPIISKPNDPQGEATEPVRECEVTSECVGTQVRLCIEADDGSSAWAEPEDCAEGSQCKEGKCRAPSTKQKKQADALDGFIESLWSTTGWHEAVDLAAVMQRARDEVLQGDGSDAAFLAAAWHALNAFPQGHQALYGSQTLCTGSIPWQHSSRLGACGRPGKEGLVVTRVVPDNVLGLSVGDTIINAGGDVGDAIFTASYDRPQCGGTFPTASGRRDVGASTFFGSVPVGMTLQVRSLAGAVREVVVPAKTNSHMDCQDPWGRSRETYASATVRPDGVAVIFVPSFVPYDKPFPMTNDQAVFDAYVNAFRDGIAEVFETVKDAPAIIWDVRGNSGGLTKVGLEIIAGFASAQPTPLSYCKSRIADSNPPAFYPMEYAHYEVAPGGKFAYIGKSAVISDGLSYSAADYFPYAAQRASDAVVIGSMTAGAFGGGAADLTINGPPVLTAGVDGVACYHALTHQPLERAPLPPTHPAVYDAADAAAGRDTLIEAAVTALGF